MDRNGEDRRGEEGIGMDRKGTVLFLIINQPKGEFYVS
jgi:uncharacterized protein YigE (DUF2233 family)